MPKAGRDDPTPPPPPAGGLITIRWWGLPEPFASEYDWEYQAAPPVPDELAARLLREVADRLSAAVHAEPGRSQGGGTAAKGSPRPPKPAQKGD